MRTYNSSLLAMVLAIFTLPVWSADIVGEGIKAYRRGDYSKAEQLYNQALSGEADPEKQAAIYRNLSILYQAQGRDNAEFSKKADELDPPHQIKRIDDHGQTMLLNARQAPVNNREPNNLQFSQSNSPVGPLFTGLPSASSPSNSTASSSPSMSLNRGSGHGFLGTSSFLGGYRYNNFPAEQRVGSFAPMYYSSQTPNSSFAYSNGTPEALITPNGRPIYFIAPGPNIYSSTQRPDGSSSTLIYRTY